MDTSKLKKFAIAARQELMGIVGAKMELVRKENSLAWRDNPKAMKALEGLIKEIGEEQTIEQVAYTWFNRFIALRFMDVHHYTKIGVVSPTEGQTQPEVLSEAKAGYIDDNIVPNETKQRISGLLNGTIQSPKPQEEVYQLLLVSYCNAFNKQLPFMFERIKDYTELLMPDDLLSSASVLTETVETLDEETCKDVEVIGWLYQYYISEKKDEVFAGLKKGKKLSKDDVPAATQIFTPEWIVKYMVQNSVGKLWLESHPNQDLQAQFKYYLESAPQDKEVEEKLKQLQNKDLKPQDIKVLDPACGSGHILVKAFEVLYEIYKSQGWQSNEIPEMILKNNLYGLDIDNRAAQLAQLAVMMKAREFDRNIFNKGIELNICSIRDTNWLDFHIGQEILDSCQDKLKAQKQIKLLQETFHNAKEYGSIIKVNGLDFDFWDEVIKYFDNEKVVSIYSPIIRGRLRYIIKQAKIMQQKYEAVIANPPYMGSKGMGEKLSEYVKQHYSMSKGDMFAVFIEVIEYFTKINCFSATINQHAWMFLSSYEDLRTFILSSYIIDTMAHLGTRAFDELAGEVVQTTTYVCRKQELPDYIGRFMRLTNYADAKLKEEKYLEFNKQDIYTCKQNGFHSIPGSPIAYWASDRVREIYTKEKLEKFGEPKSGILTGNNDEFMRFWNEVSFNKINLYARTVEDTVHDYIKWYPYNKGGNFRKWYGNFEYIVNMQNKGHDIVYSGKNNNHRLRDFNFYFKKGFTWTSLTSGDFNARYCPEGMLNDSKGPLCYIYNQNDINYILGCVNSNVVNFLLSLTAATMDFNLVNVANIPTLIGTAEQKQQIDTLVEQNIAISKDDWDSFETSWDFEMHPLLRFSNHNKRLVDYENISKVEPVTNGDKISDCFAKWAEYKEKQFNQLKANEEELNRLFIEIYGLQDEMTPEVADKDITVAKADELREVKSLISYAVGCMFGRYSLDSKGLVYAGGDFDAENYTIFEADKDNAIPVLSEHYFADDIVERFNNFIKVAFGETHYVENLTYIANILGKKNSQSTEQVLRDYFIKDFYKDHVQMYQKRPIYWMFSSEKNNFNALIYLHRYNKDTVNIVLNEYLREYQNKLSSQIDTCSAMIDKGDIKASKQKTALQASLNEAEDYERNILFPLATERKEIDLDDGVKVNYLKFGKALRNIGLKEKA